MDKKDVISERRRTRGRILPTEGREAGESAVNPAKDSGIHGKGWSGHEEDIGVSSERSKGSRKDLSTRSYSSKMEASDDYIFGHPAGSAAADFLERHQRRREEHKERENEVTAKLKIVLEHNPDTSGSIPDVDLVLPIDDTDSSDFHGDRLL
ncbi:unnamed protein product [Discosporangium mesarthrocarpum]